jgi:hypothetical protein
MFRRFEAMASEDGDVPPVRVVVTANVQASVRSILKAEHRRQAHPYPQFQGSERRCVRDVWVTFANSVPGPVLLPHTHQRIGGAPWPPRPLCQIHAS